jgi:hypothetical protein
MYVPKIVLISFYIIGFLLLIVYILCCRASKQTFNNKNPIKFVPNNNSNKIVFINKEQYLSIYARLALFIDKIFK